MLSIVKGRKWLGKLTHKLSDPQDTADIELALGLPGKLEFPVRTETEDVDFHLKTLEIILGLLLPNDPLSAMTFKSQIVNQVERNAVKDLLHAREHRKVTNPGEEL